MCKTLDSFSFNNQLVLKIIDQIIVKYWVNDLMEIIEIRLFWKNNKKLLIYGNERNKIILKQTIKSGSSFLESDIVTSVCSVFSLDSHCSSFFTKTMLNELSI